MNVRAEKRFCGATITKPDRAPTKSIQLDSLQAQRWLDYLEPWAASGEHAAALAEFLEQLDDALWLAKWKREYVVMDLQLAVVPSLLEAIVSREPQLACDQSFDVREDILSTLSKMSGWT